MIDIRQFKQDEIAEINTYVTTQVPLSELPKLFVLTEEPLKKAKIFVMVFRILNACADYISDDETKKKLKDYLNPFKEIYNILYDYVIREDSNSVNYARHYRENIIRKLVLEHNFLINVLINGFLVFAEKQILHNQDRITGINLEVPEGEEIYKKIIGSLQQ